MGTKMIMGVLVIVLLAVGGYFVYQNYSAVGKQNPKASEDVVQAQDVVVGKGTQATPGSSVSVLYVGRLSDGTIFDSSEAHKNNPLTFQLGAPGIIAGFQIGVNGMREGGERTMAIPPSFGYGAQEVKDPGTNVVIIPASSTLVFNVKLLKVVLPVATTTPTP